MFGFWLGVYLALGLPISVGLAIVESGAPLIRRVLMALHILPLWPLWSVGMFLAWRQMARPRTSCAWCGEVVGDDEQDWRKHLMDCPQHPIREWLRDHGWDIARYCGDGDYVLVEYIDPKNRGWAIYEDEDRITIIPLNDLKEHDKSCLCACQPKIEDVNGKTIITHNAYDFRDVAEYLNEKKDGEP